MGAMPIRQSSHTEVVAEGRTVTVTNPSNLYERPTVLERYPDGATGESSFQKRSPARRPGWIETVTVRTRSSRCSTRCATTWAERSQDGERQGARGLRAPLRYAAAPMGPLVAPRSTRPDESAVCRICAGPASWRYSVCTSCRDVAVSLGRPLLPVRAITTVTSSSTIYRALRQYKSATHVAARRQTAFLASLLAGFAHAHVSSMPLGSADTTVVVPSGPGGRPPPHPLSTVAADAGLGPVSPWLSVRTARSGAVGRRRACRDAFVASPDVAGRRVLLLDDVYTTGAHLQSAAAALHDAGAAEVQALVIARFARSPLPGASAMPLPCRRDPVRGSPTG